MTIRSLQYLLGYGVHMADEPGNIAPPPLPDDLRLARRFTSEPDPEGWSAEDVPDSERVDDDFIEREIESTDVPVRRYEALAPEDDELFPPVPDSDHLEYTRFRDYHESSVDDA